MGRDSRQVITDYIINHQEKFYRLALSYVRNPQDALDVVQNAVVRALEAAASLRNPDAVKTWFYRIIVNESISYIRRSQREYAKDPSLFPEEGYEEPGYEGESDIMEHIRRLPAEIQTVVLLRYYEDLTLKEISEVTQSKLSTVKYRLYTGIRKLEQSLRRGKEDHDG